MKEKITNKTVLITGAGTGIGKAIAYKMAEKGAHLLLTGLDIENLNAVKEKCTAMGVKAAAHTVDLSAASSVDALVEYINENQINIDIFVLNAGISQRAYTLDTSFDVDKKIMEVNFFGSVYLIKKFAEKIKTGRLTQIAVTTSISGLFGFPLRSSYCASKHALFGFFESLDLEYDNISVTFLIPGRINTQISKNALLADGKAYEKMDKGQESGMDVEKCAKIAIRAIEKKRRRKLIGKHELLMVYINKFLPGLYYKLAKNISAT
ncbi:MAG: SDR family NAD(P)-dependent oxidoreductase [Bacteroidales bacterium]|jgi:short-subunit dehydrogenase|nr:SDR family NAD(P)-dependent oxidoreductase [Bacteroidales bacterium]